ncbi:hypothetical protein L873DRAFT_1802657 [Choiromyces venosus 120613-1]|uniref:Uncharacterized protein n=1 Tax=Choiromyces venosus 120613-1 TaxID=1336337 RepID=A0A3N4JVI8_9PEZI|nr:hypothetical protein L873DRAFT_1802657 [Choiromyces venosus 120613-1]
MLQNFPEFSAQLPNFFTTNTTVSPISLTTTVISSVSSLATTHLVFFLKNQPFFTVATVVPSPLLP